MRSCSPAVRVGVDVVADGPASAVSVAAGGFEVEVGAGGGVGRLGPAEEAGGGGKYAEEAK